MRLAPVKRAPSWSMYDESMYDGDLFQSVEESEENSGSDKFQVLREIKWHLWQYASSTAASGAVRQPPRVISLYEVCTHWLDRTFELLREAMKPTPIVANHKRKAQNGKRPIQKYFLDSMRVAS